MRIVYLAAGAAGMYCGSCLHDNTLAAALLAEGEEVQLVPTYTPIRTDEEDVSLKRVFFGGINVYLQQKSPLFRHTPWFLDRILDSPGLIKVATKLGPGVEPQRLGDLTLSMLRGEEGNQRKELLKLVEWLRTDARPDVVHLSNAMLIGMAREIRRLGIPVVCSLSGEDIFLEQLEEPYYSRVREVLRERANDVDAFVALNRYYADYMTDYMRLTPDRVHVVPHGLNLAGYAAEPPKVTSTEVQIGYLARICPEKGFHHLVEAFEQLLQETSLPPLRLRAAGYLGERDKPYLSALRVRSTTWKEPSRFDYLGEVSREGKIAFLRSLHVMTVPTVYRESKGISVLEALACGVPVVVPAHGTFPELIEQTGGGLLFEADNPRALAAALTELIRDPERAAELGRRGQQAIHSQFTARAMANKTLQIYRRLQIRSAPSDNEAEVRAGATPAQGD